MHSPVTLMLQKVRKVVLMIQAVIQAAEQITEAAVPLNNHTRAQLDA